MTAQTFEAEPVPVDVTDPSAVMTAVGFDPATVQAVVLSPVGMLGISAAYPPTPGEIIPGPPPPEPVEA